MKTRNDFVSNSSSSSFIVSKEEHGCYFHQLINMIKKLPDYSMDVISIVFDKSVKPIDLLFGYELVDNLKITGWNTDFKDTFWNVARVRDITNSKLVTTISTNSTTFVGKIPCKLIEHITEVHGYFADDQEGGSSASKELLTNLKNTGFKFNWSR